MSKSRAALGALFAVALCFCAFGVANASAANVEAHICSESPTAGSLQRYDSGCEVTDPSGKFGWQLIPEKTEVELAGSASSLSMTLGGSLLRIACTGQTGTGKVENVAGRGVGSAIFVTYTGCSVTNPTGKRCAVATTLSTNEMKAETNEMKVKYEPVGANFITINVTQGTGLTCPEFLLGNRNLTGQLTAVVPEMGNIQEFTETSGSALEYGGQAATYVGSNSLHMKGTSNTIGAVTP